MDLKPADWFALLPKYLGDRFGRPLAGTFAVLAALAVMIILGAIAVTHVRAALAPPANASAAPTASKAAPTASPTLPPKVSEPKTTPKPACAPGANCSSGQTGGQSVGTNRGTINIGR